MPITLAQPSPMSPAFAAGGGAAQQYSRDLPSLVSLFESLYRGGGGGHGGGGYHSPFPFAAMGGGLGRAQHMGGAGGGGGGGMGGQVSPLLISERNEMARLQAAKSAIQMDPSLKPEEKQMMIKQVDAHLNPYQIRAQQQAYQMKEQQKKQLMDQNAFMASMGNEDEAARAAAIHKRVVRDSTGKEVGFIDHKGDIKPLPHNEAKEKREEAEKKHKEDLTWKAQTQARAELKKPDGSPPDPEAVEKRTQQILDTHEKLTNPKAAEEKAQARAWEEAQRVMQQRGITPYPFPGEAGAEQGAQQMGTQPLAQGAGPQPRYQNPLGNAWRDKADAALGNVSKEATERIWPKGQPEPAPEETGNLQREFQP